MSMQLVKKLKMREDVGIETLIMKASWQMIGIKTFLFLIRLLHKIPSRISENRPDVILFSSMVTASITPLLRSKHVPLVTINHGQDVTLPFSLYQWYLPKVFDRLDGVISVSSATRKECIKRGMDPKKGVALPNGFDMETMEELPDRDKARTEIEKMFGMNLNGKRLLLSVGRQVKRKGHEWFIKNCFDNIGSDVFYLIIGDGPEHERIRRARESSDRKERIIVAGKQPEEILNRAYAAADLFIMPNIPVEGDMEGFGIVLLEANRAGVPAIASDLEGIKDVIEQGVNGYRVPAREPEIFVKKIDIVLNNELNELSEKSISYVKENFSWDRVVDKYISYLCHVSERVNGTVD